MTSHIPGKTQMESFMASWHQSPLHSSGRDNGLTICFGSYIAVCALVLWTGDSQPGGMIQSGPSLLHEIPSSAWSAVETLGLRLWPLITLAVVQFVFIFSFARLYDANGSIITLKICSAQQSRRICTAIIGASFVLSMLAVWDLRAFPNSGDEYSYLFGARTFIAGRLWNPAPEN
jgi:hypothetical protein